MCLAPQTMLKQTLLSNDGYLTPLSATGDWHGLGSVRTKITRSGTTGEAFRIQFTETMGSGGNRWGYYYSRQL